MKWFSIVLNVFIYKKISARDTVAPKDPAAEDASAEAAEPEEQVKTLEEYLAEKANKSLKVSLPEARKANEGSQPDKKFENAVALVKEEEPDFFVKVRKIIYSWSYIEVMMDEEKGK